MSKFNSYARKFNDLAVAAFAEYQKAEKAYQTAEQTARQYPQRMGVVDAEYAAKSARAQADFLEAKNALRTAREKLAGKQDEIRKLRSELAADIETSFMADPAALDSNTLELVKSGMLKPNEYLYLMRKAAENNNPTMARVIGHYAGEASKGADGEASRVLRIAEYESRAYTGADRLEAFDSMTEVYNRCANNPAIIGHWGEFTAQTVENF